MTNKNSVKVIAEIGVNHNGNLQLACELSEKAVAAGADVVKFQTFDPAELTDESAVSAPYQSDVGMSQREMLSGLSLSRADFLKLSNFVSSLGSEFLTTAFDTDSLKFAIGELGIKRIKIPSGEITNPYLLHFAGTSKLPIILSTGMATEIEILQAVQIIGLGRESLPLYDFRSGSNPVFAPNKTDDLILMHCISLYPCPNEKLNLASISRFNSFSGCGLGLSDHTSSIIAPALSVAYGTTWIEKHLTLDREMSGPDHKASIEPHEFKKMVDLIREAEALIGSAERVISQEEIEMRRFARRGLYLNQDLLKDHKLTLNDVRIARPETGITPIEILNEIFLSNQNLTKDSPVTPEFLYRNRSE